MRQFSFAWQNAFGDKYGEVVEPMLRRQESAFSQNQKTSGLELGHLLCKPETRPSFDNRGVVLPEGQHAPPSPKIYQLAFVDVQTSIPENVPPGKGSVAVFNDGLHLLGGYVDNGRWHGSIEKMRFVASLGDSYPDLLRSTVEHLRQKGYSRVVYKNTNHVNPSRFFGKWKESTDACLRGTLRSNASKCEPLVDACVRVNGRWLEDCCRNLAFDPVGSFHVNELAAGTLLKRPIREFRPHEVVGRERFFNEHAAVDGFLDAQALTRSHSECCVDGRHYFQLELANVRVLSDAMVFW